MITQAIKMAGALPEHEKAVKGIYDTVGLMFEKGGIEELTEGRFQGDPLRSYEYAQILQQNHLIELAGLKPNDSFLDIGCGHGVLLNQAKKQGIIGTGITLSERQIRDHKDLDTHLLNWRDIQQKKPEWEGRFDAITAIGSLEHYVSPEEAANNMSGEIYKSFLEVAKWLLKPGGKLVVTAIHYLPELILKPELATNLFLKPWKYFSGQFHLGTLAWLGGAYYPTIGELPPIAKDLGFNLSLEEDGTQDYYFTSEEWMRRSRRVLLTTNFIKTLLLEKSKKFPSHAKYGLFCLFLFQSWNWQFRPKNGQAPTKLLRYVWEKR